MELSSEAVVSLAVTPANATLPLGTVQQFTATAALSGGATQDITSFATWTSSAPPVAIVEAKGFVTAFGVGTATITAVSEGVSGSSTVTVTFF